MIVKESVNIKLAFMTYIKMVIMLSVSSLVCEKGKSGVIRERGLVEQSLFLLWKQGSKEQQLETSNRIIIQIPQSMTSLYFWTFTI